MTVFSNAFELVVNLRESWWNCNNLFNIITINGNSLHKKGMAQSYARGDLDWILGKGSSPGTGIGSPGK